MLIGVLETNKKNATCKKEFTKQYSIQSKLIKVTSYFNKNFISNNHLSETI